VMLDGLEITQFTYFQQCGGIDLDPICAELTYGLERISAFLQDVDSIYDIVWAKDPESGREVTYREVRYQDELQMSVYNFERADVASLWTHFNLYEKECLELLESFKRIRTAPAGPEYKLIVTRFPLLAAYELCLKCSHLFNLLDARGAISVTERVGVMGRVRQLAVGVARDYLHQQEIEAGKLPTQGAANA
jgi:glycyl-tRNA synthetase alpha chain